MCLFPLRVIFSDPFVLASYLIEIPNHWRQAEKGCIFVRYATSCLYTSLCRYVM